MTSPLQITTEFQAACDQIEAGESVFVTGRAGTGKSTLLTHFRETTQKNVAVLAPTGVAAINVRGETIHAFFGFKPDITVDTVKKLSPAKRAAYQKIDTIIIDEVSMVRADLLDAVARFLALNGKTPDRPFGGTQMVLFGDLYQLPPVVSRTEQIIFQEHYDSPYFFSAHAFESLDWTSVELTHVFRQTDDRFLDILNRVRNETVLPEDLAALNARVQEKIDLDHLTDYVFLTTTNEQVRVINQERLDRLPERAQTFEAVVDGNFGKSAFPTETSLSLKVGARVMLMNNDSAGRWVNGTMGQIKKIHSKDDLLVVTLPDGREEEVTPHTWEMFHFEWNRDSGRLHPSIIGTFTQFPVRLAWAITIHKSQGLTFDRAVIDLARGTFSHGQLYVALSRLRTLDGLILTRPVKKAHILLDHRIQQFLTGRHYQASEIRQPIDQKIAAIRTAIQNGWDIEITYLKTADERSRRRVTPIKVGPEVYQKKSFIGLTAWCHLRKDERMFRIDRILEMQEMRSEK